MTGCGSVPPHTTKAALTSSVLFLPVLRTLKGDFTRAAKGAVSPGVHIVIFSCDAFLLRISFRYSSPVTTWSARVNGTLRALADQNASGQAEPSGDTKTKFTLTEKQP